MIIGLNLGGAETALTRQLLCEPRDTHNVCVVSLTDLGVLGAQLEQHGYRVFCLGLGGVFSLPKVFWGLVRLFRQLKPDVVQTWMYHADLIGGLASRYVGCKRVFWGVRCTTVPIGSRTTYSIMKVCAFLSKRVPHKVICVAQAAKQSHIDYGYQADKMVVIPNGFDTERFNLQKVINDGKQVVFKQQADTVVIGCVGRFHTDKGQDVLIDAAKQVIDRLASDIQSTPLNIQFVLVGPGCDQQNQHLVEQLKALNIAEYFTLYGQTDNTPGVLAGFDIFCMPSRTEGFPNCLAEAMAMSLPCVATDVGDAKLLGGDIVSVVKSDDAEALSNGLIDMLNMNKKQRIKMGKQATNRIEQHYSIGSIKAKFQALINA